MLLWQLGFRVMTLRGGGASLTCPPWAPKRAVEDKPGQNSDKTFHYTTSAADANDLGGLYAS